MKLDPRLLRLALLGRAALFFAILSGFVGGLLLIIQARVLTNVIDGVFLDGLTLGDVRNLLGILIVIVCSRSVFSLLGEVAANRVAGRVKVVLRHRLLAHIFELGPAHIREMQSGEFTHILSEGIESIDSYYSQYLPQVVLAVLIPASILFFILPLDLLSGFLLLLTGPLIPFFMTLIGSQADVQTKKQWQSLSRLSARFLDALQGLTTLKLLGRSKDFAAELAHASERYRQITMKVLRVTFLSSLTLEWLATISTALVAVQVGLRLLYGYINFEQAFFVLLLTPEFYLPLRTLGACFHAGMAGVAAGERIFQVLGQKTDVQSKIYSATSMVNQIAENTQYTIRFERVSYTYPNGPQVLHNVTFDLQPSILTVLTGPTGSGKSTLVNLLLGFIQPTSGQILVERPTLPSTFDLSSGCSSYASNEIHRQQIPIAWVPQHPYLFNETVAANLRLVCPDASQADLIAAAQLAQADEFIQALPQGYDTVIGERGIRLSGGQMQRLALARAFLMNAPILVLDEPTAQLDSNTEALILRNLKHLAMERIVLLITHRPAAIAIAEQVIRLDVKCSQNKSFSAQPSQPSDFDFQRSTLSSPGFRASPFPSPNIHPLSWLSSLLIPFSGRIVLSVLLGFAAIVAGIGLMSTSAYILAAAALHPSIAALQVAIVGVRFFGLSRGVFRYLDRLISHDTTFRVLAHLRNWFFRTIEPLAPAGLTDIHSGDLLERVIADINTLENFYVRSVAPPLVAMLVGLMTSLLLWLFDPRLAVALLFFLILQGFASPTVLHSLAKSPGRQLVETRACLNVLLVDALQGMADLLACRAAEYWKVRVSVVSHKILAVQARMAHLRGLQKAFGVLLSNLALWTIVVLAIPLTSKGLFGGVWLPVLALIALTSFDAILPLPLAAAHLESHRQAAARLLTLAVQPPVVTEPSASSQLHLPITINANDLSFTYPRCDSSFQPTLQGITFALPPGKRLAIVGPSGAGKTTLLNLLLRFYDLPKQSASSFCLNNLPFSAYSSTFLHQHIAVISQHTYLFCATIRENLLLACPNAIDEQLDRAVHAAQLDMWIASLPQGYDTWIGEHGLCISGGERQRIAIARALLQDAPLLLLDEPTAHLDTLTEQAVLGDLHNLIGDRSVLWATHRLVGMEWMDEIIVLDGGCIIERGTHAELLTTGERYSQMWNMQNKGKIL